ncbi:hypothetical protein J0H58_26985 [bacterium]|nr:hypothetical protein [bacterium]
MVPLYNDWQDSSADLRAVMGGALDDVEQVTTTLTKKEVSFALLQTALPAVPTKFHPVFQAVIAACKAASLYKSSNDLSGLYDAIKWNGLFVWPEAVQAALMAFESGRQFRWQKRSIDISSEIRQDFLLAKAEATRRAARRTGAFNRSKDEVSHPSLFGLLWPDDTPLGWGHSVLSEATPPAANPRTDTATAPIRCPLRTQCPMSDIENLIQRPATPAERPATPAEAPELVRGRLLKAFQGVVEGAFDQDSLAQLLRFDLGVRLDLIVLGANFEEVVFRLLMWAEQRGRLRELVTAIALARGQRPDVQAAANAILQVEV